VSLNEKMKKRNYKKWRVLKMLDMDKVNKHFTEILETNNNEKMVEFAKEIIPKLIDDVNEARMNYVKSITLPKRK